MIRQRPESPRSGERGLDSPSTVLCVCAKEVDMITRWHSGRRDFSNMFSSMNQLRQHMERLFEEGALEEASWVGGWPRTNLGDTGEALVLSAEVPGLTEKDVQITLHQDTVSISGERRLDVPSGYSVHRQERREVGFSRSFMLPCKVSAENASATVKDGILTVTLPKAAEAVPRQIAVNAE
jgi:HSP20 family protein